MRLALATLVKTNIRNKKGLATSPAPLQTSESSARFAIPASFAPLTIAAVPAFLGALL